MNVNNIYIRKPSRFFVKPGVGCAAGFIFWRPKDLMTHLTTHLMEVPAAALPSTAPVFQAINGVVYEIDQLFYPHN